jgi:hypothetical protein
VSDLARYQIRFAIMSRLLNKVPNRWPVQQREKQLVSDISNVKRPWFVAFAHIQRFISKL